MFSVDDIGVANGRLAVFNMLGNLTNWNLCSQKN